MLRPYHAGDASPWPQWGRGRFVSLLALGGTATVAAAVLLSPFASFTNGAVWRWGVASACLVLGFAASLLATGYALRTARRWQTAAVEAQHQLLLPQMTTVTDATAVALTNAITAPLAHVAPLATMPVTAPGWPMPPETDTATRGTAPATGEPDRRRGTHATATQPVSAPHTVLYDPLTGAITHSALMSRLEADVAFAMEHDRPLALAIFDLDHFRTINTLYGYAFGDEVLFAVAERLRSRLSEDALLARLGADRFAVVWAGTHFAQARAVTEGILTALGAEPLTLTQAANGHTERVRVTLRAGLALCPDDGRSAAALLELAEQALAHSGSFNALRDTDEHLALPSGGAFAEQQGQEPSPANVALSYLDVMLAKNGSIQALASAMEARDIEGIDHARNLAELAQETALLLGRSVEESRLVGLAALLHDVGNLGIPAEILQKSDPLSTEEWAFVREHPHLGERLLTSVGGVLAAIAPIIAAQRERWDGSGYPLGTRGEAIPLGARIVAVCDVYGALISDRPYRRAFTHAEALGELERCSGTQFDPAVVAAFISSADAE